MMKILVATLAWSALLPALGHAQGFFWGAPSARASSLGGVYVPSGTGVMDAIAINPAGLRQVERPVLNAAVAGVFARGTFSNSVNAGVPMHTSPAAVPFGAFALPLRNTRWTLGVAELPAITGDANWTYQDPPGAAGASYGLQQNQSKIVVYRTLGAAAVMLNRRVQMGFSGGVDYNRNTLIAPYIFQTQPAVKGLKTLLNLHTAGYGGHGGAGMLVRLSPHLQLGVSYHSRTKVRSTGTATGNLQAQLVAAGLAGARPDFAYDAQVQNTFPQQLTVHQVWTVRPGWSIAGQVQWVAWKSAFRTLKTDLSNGNNADVNGLVGSNALHDEMPLYWKDQFPIRVGVEHAVSENLTARAGFAHVNTATPASTVTPMTAVLLNNQLTAGGGWRRGSMTVDASYGYTLSGSSYTAKSALLAGEYNNSSIHSGVQVVTLSSAVVF